MSALVILGISASGGDALALLALKKSYRHLTRVPRSGLLGETGDPLCRRAVPLSAVCALEIDVCLLIAQGLQILIGARRR
jgi:hypothetical protein